MFWVVDCLDNFFSSLIVRNLEKSIIDRNWSRVYCYKCNIFTPSKLKENNRKCDMCNKFIYSKQIFSNERFKYLCFHCSELDVMELFNQKLDNI